MIKHTILEMISKDDYVSGEEISKRLRISRTAVWKHIKKLREMGYSIESKRNQGYRLCFRPDIPYPEEVSCHLDTTTIGRHLFHFDSLDSTNTYAKHIMKDHPLEGTVIVSERQTKGRGRKNRGWDSASGGLWFSVILYPEISPQKAMHVTMIASIAIVKAIKDVCGVSVQIKWPNDLLYRGRKLCGILTELDAEMDRIHYTIIGIGINVNNQLSPEFLSTATSLKQILNHPIHRVDLISSILNHLDGLYEYLKTNQLDAIRSIWLQHANIIGRTIVVHGEKKDITGSVQGIDENGCLVVKQNDSIIHILSGDIEYI